MYGRDGYDYDGYRLRVEFPRSGRGGGRGGVGGGVGAPRGRYGPPSRRSEYRVIVSGRWCQFYVFLILFISLFEVLCVMTQKKICAY